MIVRPLRAIARLLIAGLLLGLAASAQTGGLQPKPASASGSLQLPWPVGVTYNPGISQNGCSYDCPPGHLGIDYYAIDWNLGSGSQVAAVSGGTVHFTTDSCGGNILWIDHGGGLISYYAHLGSYASGLSDGNTVAAGQLVAYSDNTGSCTSGASPAFRHAQRRNQLEQRKSLPARTDGSTQRRHLHRIWILWHV